MTVAASSTLGKNAKGGGVYASGYLELKDSIVSGNHTEGEEAHGGGVFSSKISMTDTILSDNYTHGYLAAGGGAYAANSIELIRSSVISNSSNHHGGGICSSFSGADDIEIIDSNISNNFAAQTGGGIWGSSGLKLSGSRVSNNISAVSMPPNTVTSAGGGHSSLGPQ